MKISAKKYFCPVCLAESTQSTNHVGEIYVKCKCGNSVLYCKEVDQEYDFDTVLVWYRCDLTKPEEAKVYNFLLEKIQGYWPGVRKWEVQGAFYVGENKWITEIGNRCRPLDYVYGFDGLDECPFVKGGNCQISLRTVFGSQWISDFGRVHNWCEIAYPNVLIRSGYYLLPTSEMRSAIDKLNGKLVLG